MKPIAIIAIIAAVVVVGGACAGVAFSGVLNGGTTGPGGDDPVVPTDPVDPTPTETPTETPTPTPTDSSMSYFSPMTSSGSSSSGSSTPHTHTYASVWSQSETHHWYEATCGHAVVKGEAVHDMDDANTFCSTCGYGDAVALVGETYYGSLGDAVSAAEAGETVTLLVDMTDKYTVTDGTKVIINPNNNKTNLTYANITDIQIEDKLGADSKVNVTGLESNELIVHFNADSKDGMKVVDYAESDKELYICSVAGLQYFAQQVNDQRDTFEGKTVMLFSDIDLDGVDWKPIGGVVSYPSITFAGTFDGQGHTVSNMKVDVSGDSGYATGGFFGSIKGVVQNLNIDNADVKSTHYAGGIVGYSSANGVKIEKCKVTNSNITSTPELLADDSYDNGDKAGGIIGYMAAGAIVDGCIVENTEISGYRDIGGIVGNAAGTVTNNKVQDVVLVINNEHNYKNYVFYTLDDYDAGEIVGEGSADTTNTYNYVTIKLAAGTYTLPSKDVMKDQTITITGTKDMVIDMTSAVTAEGSTITFNGVTVKFDNDNYEGLQHSTKVVYNDCTLIGTQFLYASEVEFNDCIFEMYDAETEYSVWTYGTNKVTFRHCTFTTHGKAILIYNEETTSSFVAAVTLTNCKFTSDDTVDTEKAVVETGSNALNTATSNKYTITITNCEQTGFGVSTKGIVTNSAWWSNKNSMDKNHLSVTIDNVKVY